jgi:N-acyl-phosphatidylethanolamine-hydrolysing phospholipase D
MGTKQLFRLGLALLLLSVLTAGLTWSLEGGEIPPAPRLHGTFRNLDPGFWRASNWTRVRFYLMSLSTMLNREHAFAPLPAAVPDVDALRQNRSAPTVTWVGHSTLLVQLDGVLISHDHYDHLDEPTVRRLARTYNPHFVVPLGIKAWLADREITNVSELDWGQAITVKELEIVCTPAQHGSARTLLDSGRRLWASWVVIGSKRFYFGGDTGYSPHLAMIGEKFGPFDLVALPIGSYTPREIAWPIHMSPEEALQASLDLRSARFIGIHWGTFKLAREPYDEPPRRIAAEVARLDLDPRSILMPKPGQTLGW